MRSFVIFVFIINVTIKVSAQANPIFPLVDMNLELSQIGIDTTSDGIQILSDSSQFSMTMNILLSDSVNINSFQVKVGSATGLGDIFQKTFSFDVFGQFSDSTSYNRYNNSVSLGLGTLSNVLHFYSQIILERTNGTLTRAISFNK